MRVLSITTATRLCIAGMLILAAPLLGQEEPLGDVARQIRANRPEHRKVWTNDDLAPKAAWPPAASGEAAAANDTKQDVAGGNSGKPAGAGKDEGSPEAKETALQKRAEEPNQQYIERINDIKKQIVAAQQEIARLQRDQIESTNLFRQSNATAPGTYEYQTQQRTLEQQIEEQQQRVVTLNQQLEDAKEAARHAGVPHASDY